MGAAIFILSVTDASAQTCSTLRAALIVDQSRLEYIPREPKCGFPNGEIRIFLIPAGSQSNIPPGAVETEGKEGNPGPDAWLDKTNGTSGMARYRIILTIPPGTNAGDYGFNIHVPGVGTLDPLVRVVDTRAYDAAYAADLERFDPFLLDALPPEAQSKQAAPEDDAEDDD